MLQLKNVLFCEKNLRKHCFWKKGRSPKGRSAFFRKKVFSKIFSQKKVSKLKHFCYFPKKSKRLEFHAFFRTSPLKREKEWKVSLNFHHKLGFLKSDDSRTLWSRLKSTYIHIFVFFRDSCWNSSLLPDGRQKMNDTANHYWIQRLEYD